MNVCLVSSSRFGLEPDHPVLKDLEELGTRVVVVFRHWQTRKLWSRGPTVFYALFPALQFQGRPLEIAFRERLDQMRKVWRVPIKDGDGEAFRIARGLERYGYKVARAVGVRFFGGLGVSGGIVRGVLETHALGVNPFERIPQGIKAYAVYHALDQKSVAATEEACAKSGAIFIGPDTQDVKAAYENAMMHWFTV